MNIGKKHILKRLGVCTGSGLLSLIFSLGCASIPQRTGLIHLDVSDPRAPSVKVTTEGVARPFLLDTGGSRSILTSLEGLPSDIEVKEGRAHSNALTKMKTAGTITLRSEIEGHGSQEVTYLYEPQYSQNILGHRDFISKWISFDFKQGLISYARESPPCRPDIKFKRLNGTHVLIPLMIGTRRAWFVWDTGAGTSLIGESWVDDSGVRTETTTPYTFHTGDGSKSRPTDKVVRVHSNIGATKVEIAFLQADLEKLREMISGRMEGILGYNVIQKFIWVFDHEQKKFCAVLNL